MSSGKSLDAWAFYNQTNYLSSNCLDTGARQARDIKDGVYLPVLAQTLKKALLTHVCQEWVLNRIESYSSRSQLDQLKPTNILTFTLRILDPRLPTGYLAYWQNFLDIHTPSVDSLPYWIGIDGPGIVSYEVLAEPVNESPPIAQVAAKDERHEYFGTEETPPATARCTSQALSHHPQCPRADPLPRGHQNCSGSTPSMLARSWNPIPSPSHSSTPNLLTQTTPWTRTPTPVTTSFLTSSPDFYLRWYGSG
ncbi:hypothetical protein EV426DRAFT_575728 [Tirmania nivea]|nr:hypothetical protein EV426DRAFT_575728 [Tirmania nivea]